MYGVREDLMIPIEPADAPAIVAAWQWLLPADLRPWFATPLGDLFLRDPAGQVYWLAVDSGTLELVAENLTDFEDDLQDPENYDLCFGESFVDLLQESGLQLAPGQCYSYRQLPLLGGEYAAENFQATELATHFGTWGRVHERLKDLPAGAEFDEDVLGLPPV